MKYHKSEQLLEYLMTVSGPDNPVKSKELEFLFNIPGSTVRGIVHELRRSGYVICSGNKGYYYSNRQSDIEATCEHIRGRIRSLNEVLVAMKRNYSPYVNQLNLLQGVGYEAQGN